MAAVDKAMERAQKAQRDAAQGQSGLFGLFDEAPKAGRDAAARRSAARAGLGRERAAGQ